MIRLSLLLIALISVGEFASLHAQVRAEIRLDVPDDSLPGIVLLCDRTYKNCGLSPTEQSKLSTLKTDPLIKVSRLGKNFRVLIDTNQNGTLLDEKQVAVAYGEKAVVRMLKSIAPKRRAFREFEIVHAPPDENSTNDEFMLRPRYVASGTLVYKRCHSRIAVLDMNFDGRFTKSDSDRGSNLRIDQNNDGKFWGKEEHRRTAELVDYCGQNFLVKSVTNTALELIPTALELAKVNQKVPGFSFKLLDGSSVSTEKLRGTPYILDFWASWCAPCVKNLPQIESIRNQFRELSVFSVNVDRPARKTLAEKIIDNVGIRGITSIRGLGNDDPLWKSFGSADGNRLAIPLYVLVDKETVVRYIGDGGQDLISLRSEVEKLLTEH